ncbi:Alpha/Beta hydrolase protein [Paraphoma chrysanthemicola]|uniref:Alpha/Beta hydrolase protein n=1 Tax=Paraphoma chrysanthemicola TaxID=798071 RepID=A0A8K0W012_9PLEO|nr:Alpha/Beta hydrolase protein [Paraphoma chrysanthemicola]
MSCPDCFRGQDHFGPTAGSETVMYGLDVYITRPPESSDKHSQNVIVLFSDAFGWGTTNLRLLADSYARRTGAQVLLPDLMDGAYINQITVGTSICKSINVLIVQAAYYIIPFFIRNPAHKRYNLAVDFVSNLRTELPAGARIGVAGFCWGAHATTRLARCDHISNANQPLIDAAFTAHPSEVKVDDFSGIKVPYSMIIGDIDFAMKIEDVKKVTGILAANTALENEVVVVPGARHGFAVRANPNDPSEKEMADQAEDQLVRWFCVHLDRPRVPAF